MSEKYLSNKIKTFQKGDIVFYEGDKDKDLYIITSGKAEIVKNILDDEVVLAHLSEGDFFGEMAIFADEVRSATVRAATDLETIIVDENSFKSQLNQLPVWFGNMFEVVIERLREMNVKIISQYKHGLGMSIVHLLYLIAEQYGTHSENQIAVSRDFLVNNIHHILGISRGTIEKHFQDFLSAKIIEISSETDKVIVNDEKELEKFIDFILSFSESSNIDDVKKKMTHATTQEIDKFYNLYKVLHHEHLDTLAIVST